MWYGVQSIFGFRWILRKVSVLSLLGVWFLGSCKNGKIIVCVLQIHCALVNFILTLKIGCFEEWPQRSWVFIIVTNASVQQFSRSVLSDSWWPHESPGLPVHHTLPEFTQTHVHQVSDAIQPSHPLSSPSPPAPNPSQHQGLFQWVNSSHEVAKVLEFQLQFFQWTPRTYLL